MNDNQTNSIKDLEKTLSSTVKSETTVKKELRRQKIFLLVLGLINNLPYVTVLSSSKTLAVHFNEEKIFPIISGTLILFSFAVDVSNMSYLIQFKHTNRIIVMTLASSFGLLLIIFSLLIGQFVFCLAGILFIGLSQTVGSTTIFGFLKAFDSTTASGFASGTGLAGVTATLFFILIEYFKIDLKFCYFFLILLNIVYFRVFLKLIDELLKHLNYKDKLSPLISDISKSKIRKMFLKELLQKESEINELLTTKNFIRIFKKTIYYSFNIFSVHYLEYSCITFLCEKTTKQFDKRKGFFLQNSFEILQFLMHCGAFMGRSSLDLIKVPYLSCITLYMCLMQVLWLFYATYQGFNIFILLISMLFVGIGTGICFVNTYYLQLDDKILKKSEKEIATSIIDISCNLGILMSSSVGYFFFETQINQ